LPVFRSHMQERSLPVARGTSARLAAIESEKRLFTSPGSARGQPLPDDRAGRAALQHRWRVVSGLAAGVEKDLDASAQPLQGTRI